MLPSTTYHLDRPHRAPNGTKGVSNQPGLQFSLGALFWLVTLLALTFAMATSREELPTSSLLPIGFTMAACHTAQRGRSLWLVGGLLLVAWGMIGIDVAMLRYNDFFDFISPNREETVAWINKERRVYCGFELAIPAALSCWAVLKAYRSSDFLRSRSRSRLIGAAVAIIVAWGLLVWRVHMIGELAILTVRVV